MTRTSSFRLSVAAASALFVLSLTFLAVHAHAHPLRAARAPTLDVVVSEVAWMGTSASPNDEWIELYNNTAAPVDLAGWTLDAADDTPHLLDYEGTLVESYFSPTDPVAFEVWDALGAAHPSSVLPSLCAAGARIKVETFAGKLHHKFAVIDVAGSDPVVVLGSTNWTAGGAYDNDENTLIVHDRDLARACHAEWQRLWSALGIGQKPGFFAP